MSPASYLAAPPRIRAFGFEVPGFLVQVPRRVNTSFYRSARPSPGLRISRRSVAYGGASCAAALGTLEARPTGQAVASREGSTTSSANARERVEKGTLARPPTSGSPPRHRARRATALDP